MNEFFKIALLCISLGLVSSCSRVLQSVDLEVDAEDNLSQEEFNVVEKTLTIKEAQAQKNSVYPRKVLKSGRGGNAQPISEQIALLSKFPDKQAVIEYKIGVGDTITFSRLIENNRSPDKLANEWPKALSTSNYKLGIGDKLAFTLIKEIKSDARIEPDKEGRLIIIKQPTVEKTINSTGRIGSDGSVLLLEVGRLEASGKTLNELRSEVRNILIRKSVSPRFQMEISDFKSQKSYLTINSASEVIFLNDQIMTIKDILTAANVGFKPGVITRIKLQRDGKEFSMLLRDIYNEKGIQIDILSGDHIFVEDSSENLMTSSSVVDHEGSIVFEGVGKIKAAGRSIEELKIEIETLMQRLPDSQNAFQIQITNFSSQTALLSTSGKPGLLVPITDSPLKLAEALTQNGLNIDGNNITRINLYRDGKAYVFTLDDLLNPNTPDIYIQSEDKVTTEILPYKENKVFILGGVNPQIFKINPANRETLADVLFTSGGPLSSSSAKRSEIYLLRGNNPVVAYHLDAQSPTRLIVADAMELRPNDILYVAEQPIMSFNRTLASILPLRILLRDIQDENIP